MQNFNLDKTFHTDTPERDNFLSRIFGIFNEEIVRFWCMNQNSQYSDLGRPNLYHSEYNRGSSLDFTLEDKAGNKFVTEMKCELAFDKYKYLELDSASQLDHHTKPAFQKFLKVAREPEFFEVRIGGKEGPIVSAKGAILIWGHVNSDKKDEIAQHFNFHDILSLQDIINDLIEWRDEDYYDYIARRHEWITEMMNYLSVKSDLPR